MILVSVGCLMSRIKKIEIAKLTKPHGIKGELKLLPFTDDIKGFKNYSFFYIREQLFNVDYYKDLNKLLVVKFKQSNSREEAEELAGALLAVPREEVAAANLLQDYLGVTVCLKDNGRQLGKIKNYYAAGSSGLFEIAGSGKKWLIPCENEYWEAVNKKKSMVVLKNYHGLLD